MRAWVLALVEAKRTPRLRFINSLQLGSNKKRAKILLKLYIFTRRKKRWGELELYELGSNSTILPVLMPEISLYFSLFSIFNCGSAREHKAPILSRVWKRNKWAGYLKKPSKVMNFTFSPKKWSDLQSSAKTQPWNVKFGETYCYKCLKIHFELTPTMLNSEFYTKRYLQPKFNQFSSPKYKSLT